jgi:hypothetical protein
LHQSIRGLEKHRILPTWRTSASLGVLLLLFTNKASLQTLPMRASDATITEHGDMEYSLTNDADQAATAWGVSVIVKDPNGTVLRQSTMAVDEYAAEALGVASDADRGSLLLRPHRPRRFVVTGPFEQGWQVTVMPLAIVFADRTSAGHPQLIERIFYGRANERDMLSRALHELRDIAAHDTGIHALNEACKRLATLVPAKDRDGPVVAVQKHLHDAQTRVPDAAVDSAAVLADAIEILQREYEAADEHAEPKKGAS